MNKDNNQKMKELIESQISDHNTEVKKQKVAMKFRFRMYGQNKLSTRLLIALASAFLMAVGLKFLIFTGGILSSGVPGLSDGFASVIGSASGNENIHLVMKWVFYSALNVPLILFGYYKVGKKFTLITLFIVVMTTAFGILFDFLPHVKDFKIFDNIGGNDKSGEVLRSLAYMLVASFEYAFAMSLAFISGASAGGTDFIATYQSMKKNKDLGGILAIIGVMTITISTLLKYFIAEGISSGSWSFYNFMSSKYLISILFMLLVSVNINKIYPKNKKIQVQIITLKADLIARELFDKHYKHSITKENVVGMYTGKERSKLTTICSYIEHRALLLIIDEIDPKAFISMESIEGIVGGFRVEKTE